MFEHYINQGSKRMRCGYTTGSCAAIAAGAAVEMLFGNKKIETKKIVTPNGVAIEVQLFDVRCENDFVCCAVKKDSGDDIDATDGILVYAKAKKNAGNGIKIIGGTGVGRITRNGLEQPLGEAAINRVPQEMIQNEVKNSCELNGYTGGIDIEIFVPLGEEIAKKTFNPRLGIVNGISILGTTGIVEPKSLKALCESILVELKVHKASGESSIILTPGNYGSNFIASYPALESIPVVQCANFIGATLDFAIELGFKHVLLVGHIGKLIKLAGGIMDTHSRTADCRAEIFTAHAALLGAQKHQLEEIMNSVTTDEAIEIAIQGGYLEKLICSLLKKQQYHIDRRVCDAFECGVVMFSNTKGILGMSDNAKNIISFWEENR